jgi:hypothetical protein
LTQPFIDDLNQLPIDVDEPANPATVFDVTTADDDLRRAAIAEGVQVL